MGVCFRLMLRLDWCFAGNYWPAETLTKTTYFYFVQFALRARVCIQVSVLFRWGIPS